MATQDDSMNFQFTSAGQSLAAQALAGTAKLDFTKAVASSDNHFADTADVAGALADLANQQQTITVKEVDTVDDDQSTVKVPVVFNKADITADYQLLTIGLYCKPDGGDEILYAVCALKDPIYMHKTVNPSTYTINLYVIVGTSANVTIKVDPAGMVSNADLTAILKDYAKKTDLPDMTDVAYKSQANVFSKQQTLSAGAVNADGKKALFEGDVAEPDLSGYAKKTDIPDVSGYAVKASLPDFTKFATTSYVDTAIAGIPKVDLTPYSTTTQMNAAIAAAKPNLAPYAQTATVNSQLAGKVDNVNAVKVDPNTSTVTNLAVKFKDGQLYINGQPAVGFNSKADADEGTAKSNSGADTLLHWTAES